MTLFLTRLSLWWSNRKNKKFQLAIVLTVESEEKLLWLQKTSGSKNIADLVNLSLATYSRILQEYAAGGSIFIEQMNGEKINLLPFKRKKS